MVGGSEEIDIVAFNSCGNEIIFGECKYWTGLVGLNVLRDLKVKARSVFWKQEQRQEYYVLFSFSGFTPELIDAAQRRG